MQRSVDQLQTDVRKVTELGLEAKALTDKVQHFEVCDQYRYFEISTMPRGRKCQVF